jgi:hypothetical protein
MAVAFFAPMARFRNLVVTDGGSISSDNANFTTDGAGNITAVTVTAPFTTSTTGVFAGKIQLNSTTSSQAIATGNTITVPANTGVILVSAAAAATGVIMPTLAISSDQEIWIVNTGGTNGITFAAQATSHVADGASDSIGANTAAKMIWDHTQSLWYRA